ncbi:MAG: hypothetical protein ACKO9H_06255, partial [Planctomycetota bacterium]
ANCRSRFLSSQVSSQKPVKTTSLIASPHRVNLPLANSNQSTRHLPLGCFREPFGFALSGSL